LTLLSCRYLQGGVPTKNQAQFYFFNSFFYRKLAEPGKNSQDSGKSPYERVKKWTRKVDLFDKDYIFIPVNQRSHWSLIIICHLGHLAHSPGENMLHQFISNTGDQCWNTQKPEENGFTSNSKDCFNN
jgi:Ulp1 family protease